jgi:hypothetical protein
MDNLGKWHTERLIAHRGGADLSAYGGGRTPKGPRWGRLRREKQMPGFLLLCVLHPLRALCVSAVKNKTAAQIFAAVFRNFPNRFLA